LARRIKNIAQYATNGTSAFLGSGTPDGTIWMKVDVVNDTELANYDESSLCGLALLTPAMLIDYAQSARTVRLVGSGNVAGSSTMHYRFMVDLNAVITSAPDPAAAQVARATAIVTRPAVGNARILLPMDVWVRADHTLTRATVNLEAGRGAKATVAVTFVRFGSSIPVPRPTGTVLDEAQLRQ
jgi:hypothetical protein